MINVGVSEKNSRIGVFANMILYRILVNVIVRCNKACKIEEYSDIKNCSYKKHLISKLVLAREEKILNTFEKSLDDKKVKCKKKIIIIVLFTCFH